MAAFTALRWLINDFFWTDMVFSPFEILFCLTAGAVGSVRSDPLQAMPMPNLPGRCSKIETQSIQ
jgi:hypothetical protein